MDQMNWCYQKVKLIKLINQLKGTGTDIKISKTQIRKAIKEGGNLWTSLISLGTKLLPYATKTVGKLARTTNDERQNRSPLSSTGCPK